MPRYFFHSRNGKYLLDEEGQEMADDHTAKTEAAILIGRLVADDPHSVWRDGALHMMVTGEDGSVLCVLSVSAVEGPRITARPSVPADPF